MDIDKKSEQSNALSIKYLESRHQEALIAKDEDLRRQKVQLVLCREVKSQYKDTIDQQLGRISELEDKHNDTVAKLRSAEKRSREQDGQLRAKIREHELLRAELQSFNSITQDSSKTLTEKLALSRELAMLKPEVEHLRSQVAHQKDVLAEKLALERQLNALEVELANEKRATQRALQRQANQDSGAEDELRQQIEALEKKLDGEKRAKERADQAQKQKEADLAQKVQDLEAKLAKQARDAESNTVAADAAIKVQELEQALASEKRDGQRRRKAIETELSEARGQIEAYEQRLGDLKAKFRGTRDELRSMRAEVAAGVGDKKAARSLAAHSMAAEKIKADAKKRRAEETSGPEPILQTPHIDDAKAKRALKKRGFNLASVVEKSTFSITPLLNKTASLNEDSVLIAATANKNPVSAVMEEDNEETQDTSEEAAAEADVMSEDESASVAVPMGPPAKKSTAADSVEAPKRRGRPPRDNVLGEATASKKNAKLPDIKEVATAAEKEKEKTTAVAATTAFGGQENRPIASKDETAAVAAKAGTAEPKKKKRKILGAANKTLFDGDDVVAGGIDSLDGAMDTPMVSRPAKPKMIGAAPAGTGNVKRTALGPARGGAAAATTAAGSAAGMAGAGGAKRNVLGGGVRNAFGAAGVGGFSPLKRHRRGVNASFLA